MSSKAAAVSATLFRNACARFATGVTVVTVVDENSHPHGMTVNSFSSVSLDPPLVLCSIDLRNAILGHFQTSLFFGINILEESQEFISRRFSSPSENRFEGVDWHLGKSGVPLIAGALAHVECAVTRSFEEGDHAVLIGRAIHADYSKDGRPLLYFGSGYQRLTNGE